MRTSSVETAWLLLKNLLFTVIVPGLAGVVVPQRIAGRSLSTPAPGPWPAVGTLLLVAGGTLYFWCLGEFMVTGRGTPAPIDPPKHLVVRGPYRFVRNPIYLSALLAILGWAAYFASAALVLYAGALWIGFHAFVVSVEEPGLHRRFGESYDQYCRSVRRWVPGRSMRISHG